VSSVAPQGNLCSCSSASHPVGSTVRIKDFLKSIPVRKQTALKNASKTLSAIKTLLQSYAFARGTVRFSLKVLKSKNDKANWQYSPVDHADSLREAAVKIIGKDAAGRCEIRLKAADGSGKADLKSEEYSLVTLLAIVNEGTLRA
jgi:DNA mismatch repair ATPase MutL